ncbi:hypothetical protein GGR52DRAFT_553727 [Hypoxylon sp. FL1284]|nr:hypothetical protein GGR52DRAFT_553727 [Hypoxylon sp. FL1284]
MTRGWTLQELLAPPKVVFYARDWSRLGSRSGHLIDDVVAATGIEKQYLLGTPIRKASVSNRMSWVAKRETTRTEDIAYCLLGIFDINMPLLYGEGIKAFSRLQQEIVKVSTDHTIFCWTWNENVPPGWLSMLAPSPDTFADAGDFRRVLPPDDVRPYSMNNVGLAMELPVIYSWTYVFAVLDAAKGREMRPERACVPLRRVAHLDQLDRLPFPSQPVHLVPPRNLGESAQRYVDRSTTYQPVPRQHLTVRSLPKVSGGIAQVALGARFKATHNVLLLLNPFSPPLRIGEKQAPSLTRQKSWSNAIFLHAYDSPAETVDLEMSMIALQRRSLGGREVNAAVMRLGYWDQQHYDVLVAVRPELEGDAAWYCKVLPSRSSNHAPDYTYESDLLPFLNSREPRTRDVSHDGEFGIAIGEDLTLAEGINARAVYIAGSKPRFSTDG